MQTTALVAAWVAFWMAPSLSTLVLVFVAFCAFSVACEEA